MYTSLGDFLRTPFAPLLLSRRGIGINRLQRQLLRHRLFLAVLLHLCPQIEDQVPSLFGLDVVGKRGHGRAVQTGHENSVNVAIRIAALWPGSLGKVEGCDRPAEIILKGRGGRSIGLAEHAMALPALHSGENFSPRFDAVGCDFRFRRNRDWSPRLLAHPARREVLNPGHQVRAFLLGERAPLRHIRAVHPAGDSVEKIFVGGQGSGRSGTAFEYAELEVARLGINPREALAVSVAIIAMAHNAITPIVTLGILGVAGDLSDVAFHADARRKVGLRELRPGSHRERQNRSRAHEKRPCLQSCSHVYPSLEIEVKSEQQFTRVQVGGAYAKSWPRTILV